MADTYYPRSDRPARTMTVRKLIEALQAAPDLDAPVIFKCPLYGVYGPEIAYSVDKVQAVTFPEERHETPEQTGWDDETGEEYQIPAETQIFHPWAGVVIE